MDNVYRLGKSPPIPLRDGNVTVTLTLNSQAADDIMGVLKDLANILNIAPPTGYQIVERTTTPPSQKLGLYRIKGKDGKEGGVYFNAIQIINKGFYLFIHLLYYQANKKNVIMYTRIFSSN